MKDKLLLKILCIAALVVAAAMSRMLPHPPNFTPISALALFGASLVTARWIGLVMSLGAMLLSDYFIGFHSGMGYVYTAFACVFLIGSWTNLSKITGILLSSLSASVVFYLITNFGVWMGSGMYSADFKGLLECYILAIPFFANTVTGDLSYCLVLFGAYSLVRTYRPQLAFA